MIGRLQAASARWGLDAVAVTTATALAAVVGVLSASSRSWHLVIFVGVMPVGLAAVVLSPRRCVQAIVVWTVCLGMLRRVVPGGSSAVLLGDPLELVAPLAIVLLFVVAVSRGALRARGPLAGSVALFTLFAIVEAFNPLQGGLRVGLGGILYLVVPMLAFWIGRTLLDPRTLRQILWIIAGLAAVDAVYGLVQTLAGLPSWDERWVQTSGYAALNVGGGIRAFGTFASSAEYGIFLGIGLICWIALLRKGGLLRLPVPLAAVALIGTALVLESSRGVVVLTVVALGLMLAARAGRRAGGAMATAIAALVVLLLAANHFRGGTVESSDSNVSALTSHLVLGLANPTGNQSTLSDHATELFDGLSNAVTQPLGHGTGSVTVAAGHFSTQSLSAEADPGNAAAAFGIVGLVCYLLIAVRGLGASYDLARRNRDAISFAVVGLVVVSFLNWLNGDLYSVMWLVWLALGWAEINQPSARASVEGSAALARRVFAARRN